MIGDRRIKYFMTLSDMSRSAASCIADLARERLGESGWFTLVLSGGATPRLLYECLAAPPYREIMPWSSTHIFWGDERCVPPDHPKSNYRLAYRSMISRVPIREENVHRIPAEKGSPEEAAASYEKTLREFFDEGVKRSSKKSRAGTSLFDLVLLGVGTDGHTASLFPGNAVLEEKSRWVAPVSAPPGYRETCRVTMTLPLINRSGTVLFLVAGAKKLETVRYITGFRDAAATHPAAMVAPRKKPIWFVAAEAG